jgi:cell division protein ZipA
MDGLRWILAGVGAVIIVLIYLWGMRARIKEQLRERRRRAARLADNAPLLGTNESLPETKSVELGLGGLGTITPDHHLADKVLVDVEITPVRRASDMPAAPTDAQAPTKPSAEPDSQPEPVSQQPPRHEEPVSQRPPRHEEPVSQRPPRQEPGQATSHKIRKESRQEPAVTKTPEMTVLLTVLAPQGQLFKGASILAVAQELNLQLSQNGVLDCFPTSEAEGKPVFSIAHLREPGIFDLSTLETIATPGLLLFMQLPGPMEAVAAVDFLVALARRLAHKLNGSVCDDRRNKITAQAIMHLRSEAAEFERRLRLQHSPH